jgi:hypothetical protein
MSKFRKLLLIVLIIAISSFIVFCINITYTFIHGKNIVKYDWLSHNVEIVDSDLGQNIYVVEKDRDIDVYNDNYRKVIDEKLEYLTSSKYTFNSPLIIYNLYGTNNLSINVFFDTEEEYYVDYTISCDNKDIVDFSRTLYNEGHNNMTKSHRYQIIGLIKGYKNVVTLNLRDSLNTIVNTKKIEIDLTNLYTGSNLVLSNKNKTNYYDDNNLNGLYTLFGNGLYISMYDNNGVLRSEIPINSYRANRILFYNGKIIFNTSKNKFVIVDRFGRIDKVIDTGNYLIHHDYKLYKNSIIFLASDENSDTQEDIIMKYNLNSDKLIKLIDLKKVFKDYKSIKNNTRLNDDEDKGLDWIHVNSFIYDNDSMVISSKKLSSIIKIININSKPEIKYIIGDQDTWKDTKYEELLLDKIGDFKIHSLQSDLSLKGNINSNKYYIRFYNSLNDNSKSSYYLYKIDENDSSFELMDSLELPNHSVYGSVGLYNDNYIATLSDKNIFLEYGSDKEVIYKYTIRSYNDIYRVYKYNYCKYWYK